MLHAHAVAGNQEKSANVFGKERSEVMCESDKRRDCAYLLGFLDDFPHAGAQRDAESLERLESDVLKAALDR